MSEVLAGGRYTVIRRLAQGGMGEVLLADYPGDPTIGVTKGLLVVKRVLAEHPSRAHQATMLREEGRVALRLLHDNLVETFFVDEHEGEPLLVMEFMSGRAMSQVLGQAKKRKEHVPVEVALAILRASACGLHFAHTLTDGTKGGRPLGLIHRDVSPANLFVTFDGRAKVIDFGVAKADDSEIRTSTGILKGKLGYMSPEHALGDKLTAASDLWSLGVCFWETLCAERLFAMASPSQTLQAISERPIPSPLQHRKDVPAHIIELAMWLLERSLDRRIASGAALVKAIDALPEAASLRRVDLGGWLSGRFPEEAEQGKSEAARSSRYRRRTPVPIGLVEGRAAVAPGEGEAPTLVVSAAAAQEARDLLAADEGDNAATIRLRMPAGLRDDVLGDDVLQEATRRVDTGARPNLGLLADADENSTLSGDTGENEPVALEPAPVAEPVAARASRTSSPGMRTSTQSRTQRLTATLPLDRGSSWVAVALLTFGALALAMGIAFSLLAPRPHVRAVMAFEDASGAFDVVVALQDAPPGARTVDATQARLKVAGVPRAVPAAELAAKLAASGVAARASLPLSPRGTLAILLPVLIAGLGILALALAVPSLLIARRGARIAAQLLLLLLSAGVIGLILERGALAWPGMQTWRSAPRLEMR